MAENKILYESRQHDKNTNKALYVALAIHWEGRKEVLGLWLADTEGAEVLDECVDGHKEPRHG